MKLLLASLLVWSLPLGAAAQLSTPTEALSFAAEPDARGPFLFQRSTPADDYLTALRTTYRLDSVAAGATTDLARVQALCAWVSRQWKHNGTNEPSKSDPLTILREAAQGKQFRCVEYGIVLSGALASLGIPARVLALKMADVETRKTGAGHVLTEVWLRDQQKWVLVDGQWDVIPFLNGVPLNAVELQKALAERAPGFTVQSPRGTTAQKYARWIQPYLYYFDINFDQRFGTKTERGALMLVPAGASNPTVFQRKYPLKHLTYTNSVASFYASPVKQ
ncbi:transglutaminase-like domain-containing protein [Hymenobacter weizhouensis]|uniref:transglutaminase-like domain-containing protein n=1 Tax=Hymenobacter sp. YIM 151500-1 TaxID=2987689 RepID=UPI0022265A1E|nr:transglutaminase-like domain-containing protein [Hymenobacter sp. YIM 151500-1]UYZ64764.1 transglutaminase-like domain-containing protein [Hymenobacter sp. YIM 151500-1]